jgi:hypothetical protein
MKRNSFLSAILFTFLLILSGCEIIGGIFKTGMGIGVIVSIIVVIFIVFLISKMKGNR